MSDFSAGALQTFMSVDADRIVNLCTSLHELWSLPLQILAALVLLYTQVYSFGSPSLHIMPSESCYALELRIVDGVSTS